MNMQAMMQQAQKLQKDMLKSKKEIDEKSYESTKEFVTVVMKGTKEIESININADSLDKEDIEALEDMLMLAINENIKHIDKDTENKMGKFGGMAGLL